MLKVFTDGRFGNTFSGAGIGDFPMENQRYSIRAR